MRLWGLDPSSLLAAIFAVKLLWNNLYTQLYRNKGSCNYRNAENNDTHWFKRMLVEIQEDFYYILFYFCIKYNSWFEGLNIVQRRWHQIISFGQLIFTIHLNWVNYSHWWMLPAIKALKTQRYTDYMKTFWASN